MNIFFTILTKIRRLCI